MGEGDLPLPGNRFEPDVRVRQSVRLADDLEVVTVPGHSPRSLAVYWSGAPGGAVLFAGDALVVWTYEDGRVQLSLGQAPPAGEAILELIARPVSLLVTCTGMVAAPSRHLERLLAAPEKCARPWRGEDGGVLM